METDLTQILEPVSNATTAPAPADSSNGSVPVLSDIVNETNGTSANVALSPAGIGEAVAESADVDNDKDDNEDNSIEISKNKFIIYTIDEDEILKEIQEKTKLDKDKIKRAITFKKKEPVKDEFEEEEVGEEKEVKVIPPTPQIDYMQKINRSIILRLG